MITKRSILVTRPSGQAESLVARLSSLGYLVSYEPMLEIQQIEPLSIYGWEASSHLPCFQHIIFVSANAVKFGLPYFLANEFLIDKRTVFYAVGSATSKLLKEAGIESISPKNDMSSEGLLELSNFQTVNEETVALVKGKGGLDQLAVTLRERGAILASLECYRRSCPMITSRQLIEKLDDNHIEIAIFSSGESLQNFLSLISAEIERFSRLKLLVPSNRVAKIARRSGWKQRLLISQNATDESVIKALSEWEKER